MPRPLHVSSRACSSWHDSSALHARLVWCRHLCLMSSHRAHVDSLSTVGKRFAKFAMDLHRNIQLTAAERGASVVSRSIVEGAVGTFDTALLKGRLVQFVQTIDSSGTQSRRLSKTTAVAVVFSSATSSSYTNPLAYANLLYKHPRIFLVFILLGLGGALFAPSIRAQQ